MDELVVKHGLRGTLGAAPQLIEELTRRGLLPGFWAAVADEMRALWAVHQRAVRDELAGWVAGVAAVPLERRIGGLGEHDASYADLIVGTLLVEVKTGYITSDLDLQRVYREVCRYATLARAAGYPITTIGLYLARYGLLWTWPRSTDQAGNI